MKRLLPLALLLVLAACVPAASVQHKHDDGVVTITTTAARALYGANLAILNASTSDPRCVEIGIDVGCRLGDLPDGRVVTVTVELRDYEAILARIAAGEEASVADFVFCQLFGFIAPERSIQTYRTFGCQPATN